MPGPGIHVKLAPMRGLGIPVKLVPMRRHGTCVKLVPMRGSGEPGEHVTLGPKRGQHGIQLSVPISWYQHLKRRMT
jgi:hypothetical protein